VSIWSGNGVHLTSNATRVAARKLMADLSSGGLGEEPANKRARLESVIPAPIAANTKETVKNQQPMPPLPRPCPPPLWLSGQLPAAPRGRGNGWRSAPSLCFCNGKEVTTVLEAVRMPTFLVCYCTPCVTLTLSWTMGWLFYVDFCFKANLPGSHT
jgi:hypothetical protein